MLKKLLAKKKVGQVHMAECKILFVILYFAIFAVMGLGSFTYFTQNTTYLRSIFAYINCETSGFSPMNCFEEVLDTRSGNIVRVLLGTSICTLSLWPVMILIFTFNPKICTKKTSSNVKLTTKTASLSSFKLY